MQATPNQAPCAIANVIVHGQGDSSGGLGVTLESLESLSFKIFARIPALDVASVGGESCKQSPSAIRQLAAGPQATETQHFQVECMFRTTRLMTACGRGLRPSIIVQHVAMSYSGEM